MGRYEAVLGESRVVIDARSSVHPIRVQTSVDGFVEAEFDDAGHVRGGVPVRGEVSVDVADLRSGNPLVDRETRRRLDPRRHPRIVGELTELVRREDLAAYHARGTLAFNGSTEPVAGDVTILVREETLTVQGEQRFDVRAWGVQPPQLLVLRVHPEVRVRLEMNLRRVG